MKFLITYYNNVSFFETILRLRCNAMCFMSMIKEGFKHPPLCTQSQFRNFRAGFAF